MKLIKLEYTDEQNCYVNPESIAYVMENKCNKTSYIQFIDEDMYRSFQYPASDLFRVLERAGVEIICEETLDDAKGE